jgi:hypothetical protein
MRWVFANSILGDDAVGNISSLAETRFRRIGTVQPFLPLLREMVAIFAVGGLLQAVTNRAAFANTGGPVRGRRSCAAARAKEEPCLRKSTTAADVFSARRR